MPPIESNVNYAVTFCNILTVSWGHHFWMSFSDIPRTLETDRLSISKHVVVPIVRVILGTSSDNQLQSQNFTTGGCYKEIFQGHSWVKSKMDSVLNIPTISRTDDWTDGWVVHPEDIRRTTTGRRVFAPSLRCARDLKSPLHLVSCTAHELPHEKTGFDFWCLHINFLHLALFLNSYLVLLLF